MATVNQIAANKFDMELYRLVHVAEERANTAAFNDDRAAWRRTADKLRIARSDVRAMMAVKDRSETI